jgi:dolichyl-phosphate beta-glucosyltransferase
MKPILSVVLPAYNESSRLPPYLEAIRIYLDTAFPQHYEVVVVDDGSDDSLCGQLAPLRVERPQLILLRHEYNWGKGSAVRTGLAAARGEIVLFADADGATPIGEEAKLRNAICHGASVAIGSRLLFLGKSAVCRSLPRDLLGNAFAWLARAVFDLPVWDTQCGFKMFRHEVLSPLLDLCHESGYLLDLEILAWAHRLGYAIAEVPVSWRDVSGSKVHLLRDGWRMLSGLARLRRALRPTDHKGRPPPKQLSPLSIASSLCSISRPPLL